MKKNNFLTIALMASMAFSTVTTQGIVAFAEEQTSGTTTSLKESYSLTIKNTGNTTHKFEIYQIFKGELTYDNGNKVLSYIEWGEGVNTDKLSDNNIDTNASKVAEGLKENNVETFAAGISKALNTATKSIEIKAGSSETLDLSAGYYLVKDVDGSQSDSSEGAYTQYLLQIVGDTETETKLDVPTSLKKVKEDDHEVTGTTDTRIASFTVGDHYNDVADYSIGETIPYELVGTLPSNYDKYTTYEYSFVDKMSDGLTLDYDSVKIYFRSSVTSETETDVTKQASIKVSDDKHSLTVSFSDLKTAVSEATKDSIFVVRYNASLNDNAVVGLNGNDNTFHLEYSNNPNGTGTGKTPDDKNIVFTYELDNEKVTYISAADYEKLTAEDKAKYTESSYDLNGDGTNEKVYRRTLSGAKFKLFTTKTDSESGAQGAVIEKGVFKRWDDVSNATELSSDENGIIKIKGLDSGIYYIEETEAPSGYNKLTERVKLELKAETVNDQSWEGKKANDALKSLTVTLNDKTKVMSDENKGTVKTEIVNYAGSTLPSTGGIGTTIMYVVGGLLVILGGAAIIIKRRSDAE